MKLHFYSLCNSSQAIPLGPPVGVAVFKVDSPSRGINKRSVVLDLTVSSENAATCSEIENDGDVSCQIDSNLSNISISVCERDIPKGSFLKPIYFVLNNGQVFSQ